MKLFSKISAGASALLISGAALATADPVADAATSFQTEFTADSALVGGAIITMAFVAVGYKWVKGMIFS